MKDFKLGEHPIAVVGMASLMPDAKELSSYWDNIVERLVSIVDVPEDRWSIDDYYDSDPLVKDKTYCKRGAFIPDIEFNPVEYGLPPNILEVTDVSQLLGLVVAKDVLEDTGISSEEDFNHDRIGITLGIGGGQKLSAALTARLQYPVIDKVLASAGVPDNERTQIIEKYKKAFVPWEENSFPGLLGNVIAGRIANRFNFGGMNSVVDAACASSLSAMKMAVNELVLGNSDLMITGGSCTDNSIFMYMSFSKTPAFTPAEFIKPFDAESNGMMVGEGIGMIALKRLEDAERDGDRIYAVIKGMGSSSDGRFKSIYAPRPEGQAKALKRAYEQAGFEPKTVGLVEAHGTGTAAGDVAEFNSLKTVFSEGNDEKQHIALGSVKSQIGHLKAAAGAAGFMKCVLALHHKVLPPTASVKTPNPKLGIEESPFYINAETRPWLPAKDGSPRRAAVSAFGFGGTNFHFVLEEYQKELQGAVRLKHVDHVSLIDAKNTEALISACEIQANALKEENNPARYQTFVEETRLREVESSHARIALLSKNSDSAIEALELAIKTLKAKQADEDWELPQGISFRSKAIESKGKVVALFPGQGSQYLRMANDLMQNYPDFREGMEKLDKLFVADGKERLSDIVYPIAAFNKDDIKAQEQHLQLTQHAQPSIGAFSLASYKLLQKAGFQADFIAGHSFGELTALCAAGVFNEDDFYFLAKSRGQAMAAPDDKDFDAGTMMAVSGDIAKLETALEKHDDVKIANFNSNSQVVIAGARDALQNAESDLKAQGFKLVKLPVSAAFHTPLVAHAQKPFADAIDTVHFSKPSIPVYSNGTGSAHDDSAESIKAALKEHILNSVQFRDEIENIYKDGGRIFVEFGPKNVLAKLTDNILTDKDDAITLSVNPATGKSADSQLKALAAKLAVLGVPLSEVDPYAAPFKVHNTEKPSPLNIKISAAAYVSDKTRKAFQDSLNDGFSLKTEAPSVTQSNTVSTPENHTQATQTQSSPQSQAKTQVVNAEINLDEFYALQNETLRVHEKYLENPSQYLNSFQSLLSQLTQLLDKNPGLEIPASIEKSLENFNAQQQETIRVHERFLKHQAEASQASLNLMKEHYSLLTGGAPVSVSAVTPSQVNSQKADNLATKTIVEDVKAEAPVVPSPVTDTAIASAPVEQAFDVKALTQEMLEVVAEKTGYPSEMIELDMDMEADLGIDSIKRVEILGSIQEEHPELPELDPEALAELRTLEQIVSYIKDQVGKLGNSAPAQASAAQFSAGSAGSSFDVQALTQEMLGVVAEKTGYPAEMIELDMDMEADLGIDSIKRVEILGSIQEEHPELPELDPEALAELRTLEQIVSYIKDQVGESGSVAPAQASAAQSTAGSSAVSSFDVKALTQEMLGVVAEKTGYPAEMIELDMDMEADLGIDSIKRVEILGSIQEEHPELPELDPEALAELRTLEQIVSYIKDQVGESGSAVAATPISTGAVASAANSFDVKALTQEMLEVVAEKTGYPADMIELDMDMEADLGIDSIKRVEILGSIQEAHPELPELDPEALAELRTLEQIVSYIKDQVGESGSSSASEVVAKVSEVASINVSDFDVQALTQEMLEVVADKTGYPADMIELDMDMEADLGIDSIKRVEILGSIQEEHPELPELDPEALAELRSLKEIISYIETTLNTGGEASSASGNEKSEVENADLVSLDEYKQSKAGDILKPARAEVQLSLIAPAEHKLSTVPENRACIIVSDGTELAAKLAKAYISLSWKVALVDVPHVKVDEAAHKIRGIKHYKLDDFEEDKIVSLISKIENDIGKTANFIFLDSVYKQSTKKSLNFEDDRVDAYKALFIFAKHLKTSLEDIEEGARNAFMTITHLDGCLGYEHQLEGKHKKSKFDPMTGAAFGLCKTLKQEWPSVFVRAIDLHREYDADEAVDLLIKENHDANQDLVEVGLREKQRFTLMPQELNKNPDAGDASSHKITEESVFLVSGGAKGVTARCVLELARETQCKFILLGRSELNDSEPDWAKDCTDEASLKKAAMQELKNTGEKPTPVVVEKFIAPVLSQREVLQNIQAIEALGSQVHYLACDVTDEKKLKKHLKTLQEETGTITGVIHGAGVLADKFIEQKSVSDFEAVFNTKIAGLASIFSAIDLKDLKHLVLFSSAAGFFGNPGQSDYAMANDVLNKLALQMRSHFEDCRIHSFNWGPWDGGMVTPQLKKLFEARGVELIGIDAGAELFKNYLCEMNYQESQILVGSSMEAESAQKKSLKFPDKPVLVKLEVNMNNNPFLSDHKIGDSAVLPMVCSAAWHAKGALALFPEMHVKTLENIQVFKGLTFDEENSSHTCIQELSDFEWNEAAQTLILRSRVFSEIDGKQVNHYGAKLVLSFVANKSDSSSVLSINKDNANNEAVASAYSNKTLFHGEGLQLLQTLYQCNEQELILGARTVNYEMEQMGDFPEFALNHFSMDALLQACLLWVREEKDSGSLPLKITEWQSFKKLQAGEKFFIHLKVIEASSSKLLCDIDCFNDAKELCTRFKGAEVTISKTLEQKFAS